MASRSRLGRTYRQARSHRAILELNAGWTSSLKLGKEFRQVLFFVDKKMSVGLRCNLSLMGHTKHLLRFRKLF